jgi:hypothetical protein
LGHHTTVHLPIVDVRRQHGDIGIGEGLPHLAREGGPWRQLVN